MTRITGLGLLFCWMMLGGLAGCGAQRTDATGQATQPVTIAGRSFELELALTPEARYQGLSGREHIAADGGMLFAFPDSRERAFVMRDCLVPIDIIFLDGQGRVVRTHQMTVEPKDTPEHELTRYPSGWPAQFAIELKGGLLDELDVKKGQRIALPLKRLKQRAR
jgi:uncharacterized membrane protein (UPF0127 family)